MMNHKFNMSGFCFAFHVVHELKGEDSWVGLCHCGSLTHHPFFGSAFACMKLLWVWTTSHFTYSQLVWP